MAACCELCEKQNGEKISYLELETWDFEYVRKVKKDFYSVCSECFDQQTNKQIEKDTSEEIRKQRSLIFKSLVDEGALCLVCDNPLVVGHICNYE